MHSEQQQQQKQQQHHPAIAMAALEEKEEESQGEMGGRLAAEEDKQRAIGDLENSWSFSNDFWWEDGTATQEDERRGQDQQQQQPQEEQALARHDGRIRPSTSILRPPTSRPKPSPAASARSRGRPRGKTAGSLRSCNDSDRDYKPPSNLHEVNHDTPLSSLSAIPRRSVRAVVLQTRPKVVDDRERRRQTFDAFHNDLATQKQKQLESKEEAPSCRPPPKSSSSKTAACAVEELDSFACQWRDCQELQEFEDLESLLAHLLAQHIKAQKGEHGKRKNMRGFVCEWQGCNEEKPFHGVREVQTHLRAKHFGGNKNKRSPTTVHSAVENHHRKRSRSCGNAKNGLGRDGSTEDREDEEMGIEQDVASCPKKRIKDRLHTIAYQEKKRRLNEDLCTLPASLGNQRESSPIPASQEQPGHRVAQTRTASLASPLPVEPSFATGASPQSLFALRCAAAAPKKRFLMRLGLGSSAQTGESIGRFSLILALTTVSLTDQFC
jgi:hypothetical protein